MTKLRLSFNAMAKKPSGRVWISNWPSTRVDIDARNIAEVRKKVAEHLQTAEFRDLVAATKACAATEGEPRISISFRAIDRKFGNFDAHTAALDDEVFNTTIDALIETQSDLAGAAA